MICGIVGGANIQGVVKLDGKKLAIEREDLRDYLSDIGIQVVESGKIVREANVDENGKFIIHNVYSDGNYTLYFNHQRLLIAPVIAVVEGKNVAGLSYDPLRSNGSVPIEYPFTNVPLSNNSPYVPEEPFDALQLLKNPMLIMGLVMVGMVYLMPKMQGNMSPEEMREMRKGLEDEGGFAASLLKNMIPAGGESSNPNAVGDNIPSITSENAARRRKQ